MGKPIHARRRTHLYSISKNYRKYSKKIENTLMIFTILSLSLREKMSLFDHFMRIVHICICPSHRIQLISEF